jgi:hypothetical protein
MNAQDILENVLRDEKIPFVDFQGLICDDENKASCPLFTPNGDLISYDGSHLTKRGALWVGSLLQEIPELKDFFSPKTFGEFP